MWLKLASFDAVKATEALLEVHRFTNGHRYRLVAPGPVKVKWDKEGYLRILENLLSNAAKYSTKNSEITVRLEAEMSKVRLSVHNRGNPILKAEQNQLFTMFKKGASGRAGKGWGLGLSIVKGIAEAHGGSVSVTSSMKEGTTFAAELPKRVR